MKRKLKKQCKLGIVFTLLALVLWNCKDDPNSTGMGLLPGSDIKTVGDVIEKESNKAFTKHDILIKTDEPNYNILGTLNDPVFGKTSANMACQVRLTTYPPYNESSQADSVVLYLLYKEVYGDTLTQQSLKVYELQDPIFADTTGIYGSGDYPYYQDADLKALANPTPIGELNFTPKFELDSTGTDTIAQELAIKLDNSIAERLIHADSLDMVDNDAFLDFFKGLYVEAQPVDAAEGGALLRIYALAAGTDLTMYYTNVTDTLVTDSLNFSYRINSNSARISSYTHDYSLTDFGAKFDDETSPDSLIYLQTLGGLRAKVEVPSLDTWIDSSDFIINKAKLIFHVDTVASDYHNFALPSFLALYAIDDKYPDGILPADYSVSPSLYGGYYNSTDATYSFIITHHLQNIIEGSQDNLGFYLSTSFQNEQARRVVLKGSSSHVGIRLEVTYTKLN